MSLLYYRRYQLPVISTSLHNPYMLFSQTAQIKYRVNIIATSFGFDFRNNSLNKRMLGLI
jgi:hypothetical protein